MQDRAITRLRQPHPVDPLWRKYSKAPVQITEGEAIRISDNKFIFSVEYNYFIDDTAYMTEQALLIYDADTGEWTKFAHFPEPHERWAGAEYPKIAVIPERRKVYLCLDGRAMRVLDMDSKEWTAVTIDRLQLVHGLNPLINANGILHCIGGPDEADHHIWNEEDSEWQCIHDFGATMGITRDPTRDMPHDDVYDFSMIFVESKQLILLIGVQDQGTSRRPGSLGSIWTFSTKYISENTWQRIEGVTFDFNRVSAVLSADQQFVIIAGGQKMSPVMEQGPQGVSDAIYVLDMRDDRNFVLRECFIRCPAFGQCITLRTGNGFSVDNHLLIVGWIRRVFRNKDMNHMLMPPDGVMRLIIEWYDKELLHWIYCSSLEWFDRFNVSDDEEIEGPENAPSPVESDHFVIPMQDVLTSSFPNQRHAS